MERELRIPETVCPFLLQRRMRDSQNLATIQKVKINVKFCESSNRINGFRDNKSVWGES